MQNAIETYAVIQQIVANVIKLNIQLTIVIKRIQLKVKQSII